MSRIPFPIGLSGEGRALCGSFRWILVGSRFLPCGSSCPAQKGGALASPRRLFFCEQLSTRFPGPSSASFDFSTLPPPLDLRSLPQNPQRSLLFVLWLVFLVSGCVSVILFVTFFVSKRPKAASDFSRGFSVKRGIFW